MPTKRQYCLTIKDKLLEIIDNGKQKIIILNAMLRTTVSFMSIIICLLNVCIKVRQLYP